MPMNDAQKPHIPLLPIAAMQAKEKEKSKKTCGCCRRKLTLTDFDCGKCKSRFCAEHRLPEQHSCGHDFVAEGRARLTEQLTKVVAQKVDQI